jgi:hypothetical protein
VRAAYAPIAYLLLSTLAFAAMGCRAAPHSESPARAEASVASPYACDGAHDYRIFATLPVLKSLNAHVPRKAQSKSQRDSLSPGDPLWQFQETAEPRCSGEGHLELRYAAKGSEDFASSRNRLTVTFAPAGRLLDPLAYDRMAKLALALDEALTELRSKPCCKDGAPCDLKRNADPLRFPASRPQYSVGGEFKKIGQRGWFWHSDNGQYQVLRAIVSTTDGRFDVEFLVESMDHATDGTDTLQLVPEVLSDEYDKVSQTKGGAAEGGSRG